MVGSLLTLLIVGAILYRIFRRNRSFPERLRELLDSAVAGGVISPEQRERLVVISGTDRAAIRFNAVTWVGILAGLFVVGGVSLLIAANWAHLGPVVRIVGFLLLFAAAGEGALRVGSRSRAAEVSLEFLWFFFPLLGIGLFAQTFHLSGDPIRPFLVWLLLTLPLAWWSPHPYVGWAHLVALAAVLFTGNFIGSGPLALSSRGLWDPSMIAPWGLTAVIWGVLFVGIRRFLPSLLRSQFVGLPVIWLFSLLVAATPFRIEQGGWLFAAAASFAAIWMLLPLLLKGGFNWVGAVVWLGVIYGLTFLWHNERGFDGFVSTPGMVLASLALAGAALLSVVAPFPGSGVGGAWSRLARGVIVVSLALPLVTLRGDPTALHAAALLANLLLASIALLFMWHGATTGTDRSVNAGVALLLLLLVTRFIDVLGRLFVSGIGLIVAGLILAALAYGMEKGRRRLLGR